MKIVYLHQYFNTPEMTGSTRSYEMARRLVNWGHEVHIVTTWREEYEQTSSDWYESIEDGIHVHWLPLPYSNHLSYSQRIKAFLKFAYASAKRAAGISADVIFATSTPLTIALPGVYAARKQRVPMIFEVRDLWPELPIAMGALNNPVLRKLAYLLERWAYRHASAVVALSPGMKEGVVNAGYPQNQVAVIPNSSDIELFQTSQEDAQNFRQAREWLQNRPLLIYAGTLGKINGVDYLVRLASQLEHIAPEVRILIVGDGAERANILELAQSLGVLNKNVFLEPKIPKKEIPTLFSAADMISSLFIDEPAMRANSANKFFDALAAGRPVMINYAGWQNELIRDFHCGVNLWGMSASSAAEVVAEHIQDKRWVQSAGIASRELAIKYFDREVLAKQLEQVFISVVEQGDTDIREYGSGIYKQQEIDCA
jgi:glycosyltransferase involved in cell wall biosynthesis